MNVNKEDPRLTAFALGELDDDERDAIGQAIEADPELQEFVKEIGVAANLAGLAIRQDDAPGLSDDQRQAVLEASELLAKPGRGAQSRFWRVARVAGVAAVVVVGLGAYSYWSIVKESGSPDGGPGSLARQIHQIDSLRLTTAEPEVAGSNEDPATLESQDYITREDSWYSTAQRHQPESAKDELLVQADVPIEAPLEQDAQRAPASTSASASTEDLETEVDANTALGLTSLDDSARSTESAEQITPRSSSLQNVQIGGEIRIRKNYYVEHPVPAQPPSSEVNAPADPQIRDLYTQAESEALNRPQSPPAEQPESKLAEARTRLNITADFENANGVTATAPEEQKTLAFFGPDATGLQSVEQQQQLARSPVPPLVPSDRESVPSGILSSVINAAANPGPPVGPPSELPNGADAKGIASRSYDIDGDGVLEDIPFYTKPDGSQVIGSTVISDAGGKPVAPSGGGGFGGGGLSGGGYGGGAFNGNATKYYFQWKTDESRVIDNTVLSSTIQAPANPGPAGTTSIAGTILNNSDGDELSVRMDRWSNEQPGKGEPDPVARERFQLSENLGDGRNNPSSGESLRYTRTKELMQEGQSYLDNQKYSKAQQYFEQVLLIDPGNKTATRLLADATVGAYKMELQEHWQQLESDQQKIREPRYLYAIRRTPGTESYAPIPVKPFTQVAQEPLSTFSVDVDTASYANVRRFLTQGQLPPPDAVRVEEMINYFDYEYAPPRGEDPISVDVEIAQCVWETQHRLARIALKAREVPMDDRGPANLVFLIDVSGSMKDANKLPLLKESMKALTRKLLPQDRVAIVTYRDAASIALSPTTVGDRITIETAINSLHADGSTNGAGGLELAYSVVSQNVIKGSINRVILATDGDFNVGETDNKRLVKLIRNSAATGVFLTVLGFGEGNLKDDRLEAMADKGNGAYHYIDNYNEATRVLCAQVGATLATVAKDVKVQIEFNPQHVAAYRLIGYENRALAAADFNNDRKDAGEMGSGENVTALYELVPPGVSTAPGRGVDGLKYQSNPEPAPPLSRESNPETMTVKIRYKDPEGDASRKFEVPVVDRGKGYDQSSRDYRWAVAVAGFGMVLRHPPLLNATWINEDGAIVTQADFVNPERLGSLTLAQVRDIAEGANGYDPDGRRAEFLSLVVAAQTLTGQ